MTEKRPVLSIGLYDKWKLRFEESFKGNAEAGSAARIKAIGQALHPATLRSVGDWPGGSQEIVHYLVREAPDELTSWVKDTKSSIALGLEGNDRVKEFCSLAETALRDKK